MSRSKKVSNNGGSGTKDGDVISNLPECVLSHILSCLPTKDVVRTCVLSRFWEYKWTSIYNIALEDQSIVPKQSNDNTCFTKFMDRILLYSQNIRSFDLSFDKRYDKSRVETWISAVFRHKVESVKLYFKYGFGPGDRAILSRSLLHCTSLRELEIEMFCTLKIPDKTCFPNLTCLYLEQVQIRNDNSSSDTLTLTFPVLEILHLTSWSWLNARFVEIYAPALSSFLSYPRHDHQVDDYLIKIFGATLGMFEIRGVNVENFHLAGSTVLNAILCITCEMLASKCGLQIRKLLNELSSVGGLKLSCDVPPVIVDTSASGQALPIFDKLEQLVISAGTHLRNHWANISVLFKLLHAAPFLNYLVINMALL